MTQALPDTAQIVASFRTSAKLRLGIEPREVQLDAAERLLRRTIVEMETGEGKTLTIAIAATCFAAAQRSVCIATANDYLAQRDADWMRPLYHDLGLSVAAVTSRSSADDRASAYESTVIYGTIREFGFDFLRAALQRREGCSYRCKDRGGKHLGPPLDVLIVDEADSVLIDEARTPLVISQPSGRVDDASQACFRWAADVATQFQPDHDFVRHGNDGPVALTESGRHKALHLAMPAEMNSHSVTEIMHALERAIWVNQTMHIDQQYIVREGKIAIVHEYTGRASEQKSFAAGVHQAIEARERLNLTPPSQPAARITIQDLADKFNHVCGITATADEDRQELRQVYGLHVVVVPPHQPSQREMFETCVCENETQKWERIADEVEQMTSLGRAVLIGTRDIAQSESLSAVLQNRQIEHLVLNARHPQHESEIVATAGATGRVTVATNMAGRGTDIPLSPEVRSAGGLHVIVSEPHAATRIDRQLIGRSARQGDPGSARLFVCPSDQILMDAFGTTKQPQQLTKRIARAQRIVQRRHRHQRSCLTAHETSLADAFRQLGLDPHLNPPPASI